MMEFMCQACGEKSYSAYSSGEWKCPYCGIINPAEGLHDQILLIPDRRQSERRQEEKQTAENIEEKRKGERRKKEGDKIGELIILKKNN